MDGAFGFGANVFSGGTVVPVSNKDELRTALANADDSGTVILVKGGENADFDFKGAAPLPVTNRKITIRLKENSKAVLKNVLFAVALDTANDIVFEDLVFHSDGEGDPNDAITIQATAPPDGSAPSNDVCRLRISHCTFDGYADIAIDTKTVVGRRRLLATIDHCLFFDARPGRDGSNDKPFYNRGAINIASLQPLHGDSFVTIANNVYIDVWRRLPRVAGGNFVHVFNNLLYRWGYTKDNTDNRTYRGIEIGGGDEITTNNGKALIEANRFIPYEERKDVKREIAFNAGTSVTLGSGANVNEFDGKGGRPLGENKDIPVVPDGQEGNFVASEVYNGIAGENLSAPPVKPASDVPWRKLVGQAGSRVLDPDSSVKRDLKKFLDDAGR